MSAGFLCFICFCINNRKNNIKSCYIYCHICSWGSNLLEKFLLVLVSAQIFLFLDELSPKPNGNQRWKISALYVMSGFSFFWACKKIFVTKNCLILHLPIPAGIYMLKVNNRNNRTRCEICSKLTIKTPEQRRRRSGVFMVNFEHISQLVLVFLLWTLNR